jgi:hypothetical protein
MHVIYYCHHCKRNTEPMSRNTELVEGEMRFCPYCSKYLDNERQFCRLCQSESTPNHRDADTCISCGETGSLVPGVGYTCLNVSAMNKMLGFCTLVVTIFLWEKRYPGWVTTFSNWLGNEYKQLMMPRPHDLCPPFPSFCLLSLLVAGGVWLLSMLYPMLLQVLTKDRVRETQCGLHSVYLGKQIGLETEAWLCIVRRLRVNHRRIFRVFLGRSKAALKRDWAALKLSFEEEVLNQN